MKKLIFLIMAAVVLSGCSAATRQSFCAGVTAGSALGGPNPFAIPCIISGGADLVMKMAKNNDQTKDQTNDK